MLPLLKFLITRIVDHPEAVKIAAAADPAGGQILTVTVDPADMGRVVGKGGKIIAAVRELVKVRAVKTNQRVRVVLAEPTQTDSLSPRSSAESPAETS